MDSAGTTTTTTQAKRNGSINWKEQVKRRIFILSWIFKYDTHTAIGDVIAGTTLGLTVLPQSMAFASLAGLPIEYGLYSSFVGTLLYVIFGTVKEVSIGPTALLSLLTLQYTSDKTKEYVILLTFLSGCIILLVGVLNLGLIVDFISIPVTNAFTTATFLYIICSQLKHIFGIDYSSKGFLDSLYHIITRVKECTLWDSVLGLSCCIFLILCRLLKYIKIKSDTSFGKTFGKCLYYLSELSSLVIVVVTSCIAYQWIEGTAPFQLSGHVKHGIPAFNLPSFGIENANKTIGFVQLCTELGSGLVVVPLVAIVINTSIAKAYSSGRILDVSQEMFTLALSNILGSCFSSMPTSAGFNRAIVFSSSGVRSPLAGVYSATLILLALSFLTPYCYFIPKATLASILIVTSAFMLDFKLPIHLWSYSKRDFWPWLGCIIVCLVVNVQIGVLFGISFNMLQLLYTWARPNIIVEVNEIDNMQFIRVSPSMGMYFPGIVKLREIVNNEMLRTQFKFPVVINCIRLTGLDFTAAQGINLLTSDLHIQKQVLVLQNLNTKLEKWLLASENLRICRRDQILKEVIKDVYLEHQSQL